jgi:spore cortex biosynthesis protein YabQ
VDSLSAQLYAFAVTMAAGASLGFVFDLYRLLRAFLRPGQLVTFVMDLGFWVIIAPLLAVYLLAANWGELRLYVLVGIGLGLAFYYLLISRIVIRLALGLARLIGFVISLVCQMVFALIAWPMKLVQDLLLTIAAARRRRRSFQFSSEWRWRKFDWRRSGLRWQSFRLVPFRRR